MQITNRPNININFKQNWNLQKTLPNSEIRLYTDGEDDCFNSFVIKNPNGILSDLEQCKVDLKPYVRLKEIELLEDYIKDTGNFADKKIYGIPGCASSAIVFDVGNDEVIKISSENPFEHRKYNPKFDIPLLSEVKKYKNAFIYLQAKADVQNTTLLDVLKVKKKMKLAGFEPSEDFSNWRNDQVGKYKGKAYLIDSRCALKKPDILTRFTDWFTKTFDRRPPKLILISDDFENSQAEMYKHIEEKPRQNYTKKEALDKIKETLKTWG